MASVLPPPDEYAALAPRPGSPVAVAFNDVRTLSTAGYALVLQVAHPTVGAGVHEYSGFATDPWGRLLRTLDYVHGTVSGGPDLAGSIGRRVREMHRTIRGVRDDGVAYHAMEPDAFAWVHATLALAVVTGHEQLVGPMSPAAKQAFWDQWLDVGRLVGVRPRDLPGRWPDFAAYADGVIRDELRWTPAIPTLMRALRAEVPPAVPGLPPAAWSVLRRPRSAQLRLVTAGLLPPKLRDRLDVPFTARDARAFRALTRLSRAAGPVVRGPLREVGPYYVRARRQALARGDVAGRVAVPRAPAAAA